MSRFAINGQISKINLSERQRVTKDEVLVELDEHQASLRLSLAQTNLKLAQAQLVEAESNLQRQLKLKERKVISDGKLRVAQLANLVASLETDRAQLKADFESAKLSLHRLTSPSDGIISGSKMNVGGIYNIEVSGSLATIYQLDPINVRARIPFERAMSRIRKAEFSVEAAKEKLEFALRFKDGSTYTHRGKTVALGFEINAETGEGSALVEFPNPLGILRPDAPVTIQVTQTDP